MDPAVEGHTYERTRDRTTAAKCSGLAQVDMLELRVAYVVGDVQLSFRRHMARIHYDKVRRLVVTFECWSCEDLYDPRRDHE